MNLSLPELPKISAAIKSRTPNHAEPSPEQPIQNHLLAALPVAEFERLAPELELVPMPLGEILHQPSRQTRFAYFPTTAVVSLQHVMASGASAEAAEVGDEGVVGLSLVMGSDNTSSSTVVRTAGHAYRLAGNVFKREFNRGEVMQRLLLRYTQALMSQMIQTAACNRHHTMDQQLCRCLLSALDRAPSGQVMMTHEVAANQLGVRREGITAIAGSLQRAGLITYVRGRVAVLKRSALESRACECYAVIRKELSGMLADMRYRREGPAVLQ